MANTQTIDDVLRQAVDSKQVPGVVAMAATEQGVVYEGAFGQRTLGQETAMTADTVLWIASMTKAITATAAMQLVERGQLQLDSAAAEVVPELAMIQVLTGFDASGVPQLRAPRRAITLRHLLTHTAGFSYDMWSADIGKYQAATGTPAMGTGKNAALMTPLLFDPGERWEYGINIDWVGKIVEAVSGQRLGNYVQHNILAPLGMHSTSFQLSPSQQARLAGMHARGADGALTVTPFAMPQEPQFEMGGGGLYSTAPDYLRFTQMLLHGGTFNGNQVLQAATVQMMSQNHIGDMECVTLKTVAPARSNDANFFPGMSQKWGLSFLMNTARTPQGRSPGSLAWAGLANTFFWIDVTKRLTGVCLMQILPFFDHQAILLFRAYEAAVYKAF